MRKLIKDKISATLLIVGTCVGAGMLGIPLVTSNLGVIPSFFITALVWFFMLCTGFLFLEATLWMHKHSNVLSMSKRFLGGSGRQIAGITFVFLYYCLMVAYFAAGAPMIKLFMESVFGISIPFWVSHFLFFLLFHIVIVFGIKVVDRLNYVLTAGLFLSYLSMLALGGKSIELSRIIPQNWSPILFAIPVLFSAFGYHNIIPSLVFHLEDDGRVMRKALVLGTLIPFIIYTAWQWLVIGAVPPDILKETVDKGAPATWALQKMTGHTSLQVLGTFFGFFAIYTSMLGVAFSVVDFLGDGLSKKQIGKNRLVLTFLALFPPLVITLFRPSIFLLALGIAGGFGEAFLNGLLPALLVWKGRYRDKLESKIRLPGGKVSLILIMAFAVLAVIIEIFILAKD